MRRFDKKKNIEKANLLAEQRHLESKSLIKEGEMWDKDATHRDTYDDTNYEDNEMYDSEEEPIHFGKAEITIQKNPKYNTYNLLVDDGDVFGSDEFAILKPEQEKEIIGYLNSGDFNEPSHLQMYIGASFYKAMWKGEERTVMVKPTVGDNSN